MKEFYHFFYGTFKGSPEGLTEEPFRMQPFFLELSRQRRKDERAQIAVLHRFCFTRPTFQTAKARAVMSDFPCENENIQ